MSSRKSRGARRRVERVIGRGGGRKSIKVSDGFRVGAIKSDPNLKVPNIQGLVELIIMMKKEVLHHYYNLRDKIFH